VPEARGRDLLTALKLEGYAQAGSLLEEDAGLPSLELYLQDSEACQASDSRLSVTSYQLNSRGKATSRRVVQGMIAPAHKAELVRAIEKRPPPDQDPEEGQGSDTVPL